ncbi:uncharacterized protein K489DRAFT_381279 [Dissoconium aciculare CBS 342.82]|uniref:Uncharacterized protein n=1 Tax=Dissoconium aciculare CBS 342.82 TaxID=1314786 RepID=A0A6J3M4S5_9PEZI|nr:uncharacterized protein K489DRAFT_381279 [Dissoconium aciculare CBS 342.82]KAF1822499.1 hypothetical protein K489DRAFT_381279 [Dissoconium aciculare CBS 342.82]
MAPARTRNIPQTPGVYVHGKHVNISLWNIPGNCSPPRGIHSVSCARQTRRALLFVIPVETSIRCDVEARRGRVEEPGCRDPARVLPDQANYTVKDPGTKDVCGRHLLDAEVRVIPEIMLCTAGTDARCNIVRRTTTLLSCALSRYRRIDSEVVVASMVPIMAPKMQSEISRNPWLFGSESCAEFEGTQCCRLSQTG